MIGITHSTTIISPSNQSLPIKTQQFTKANVRQLGRLGAPRQRYPHDISIEYRVLHHIPIENIDIPVYIPLKSQIIFPLNASNFDLPGRYHDFFQGVSHLNISQLHIPIFNSYIYIRIFIWGYPSYPKISPSFSVSTVSIPRLPGFHPSSSSEISSPHCCCKMRRTEASGTSCTWNLQTQREKREILSGIQAIMGLNNQK